MRALGQSVQGLLINPDAHCLAQAHVTAPANQGASPCRARRGLAMLYVVFWALSGAQMDWTSLSSVSFGGYSCELCPIAPSPPAKRGKSESPAARTRHWEATDWEATGWACGPGRL